MRISTIILAAVIFFFGGILTIYGQNCYEVIADKSGMDIAPYQAELEAAACELIQTFPEEFQDSFKVYSFGFYSQHESMDYGFNAVWEKVISDIESPYYLIFGKQTDKNGVYTKFWVDLVLPRENIFYCIDQLSLNLRENLRKKYEIIANQTHELNNKSNTQYKISEIEVMNQISDYLEEISDCCDYQNRSSSGCSTCVLNESQFEWKLEDEGLLGASVAKIIDNTYPGMGMEEIGYTIESNNIIIDLDVAIASFISQIHSKFPETEIEVYPFNFESNCSDFNNLYSSFKSTNADIGIIIGVTGSNGDKGNLWWQMISNDDEPIDPGTFFNSDTCYFFDEEKRYTHKYHCIGGFTPRGVLQDLDGNNFNLDFRFADPEITPRTLTNLDIQDGELQRYGETDEPLINKAMLMKKSLILNQLMEIVPDNSGNFQAGAFDYHIFAPWSLLWGSGGPSAPFDYSTKDFFLDRENYIFITDDGINVVGHNFRNMGNFLWGAATYIMGVPQWMALGGAHSQNIFGEFGSGGLDETDDQYSIKLGRAFAKTMKWKTIYGGKNNIFKQ